MPSVSALPASPVVRSTAATSPSCATSTSPVVLKLVGTCERTSYFTGMLRTSFSPAGSVTVSVTVASTEARLDFEYSIGGVSVLPLLVSFITALPAPVVLDMLHAAL